MYYEDGHRLPTVTDKMIRGFFGRYRFLSNFHLCPVYVQGITYPSSEHAYMAMKTLKIMQRREISKLETPREAKIFGTSARIKLRPNWDEIRLDKMYDVLRCKFVQNKELRLLLAGTADRYLEETNDWNDTFWGVCDGVGQNNLGKTLMRLRKELS
jgi:ribA/ribD-fused uncharacterized protein